MKRFFLMLFLLAGFLFNSSNKIFAQDAYLGDIKMTAITFAQSGWLECNGQLLQISQYQALFALIGTTYGGNGTTNFALPDLRSRIPVGVGQGNGLTNYTLGETGGVESVALTTSQMPAHSHGLSVSTDAGNTNIPNASYLGNTGNFDKEYSTTSTTTNPLMVQSSGNGQAHENRQPYLTVRYVICVNGIFPSRP